MSKSEITLLLGFISSTLVPFIISYLKKVQWEDKYKVMLSMVVSGIAGVLTTYSTGELHSIYEGKWITTGLAIWGASTLFYHTAFKDLGVEQKINPDHVPEKIPIVEITDDIRTP